MNQIDNFYLVINGVYYCDLREAVLLVSKHGLLSPNSVLSVIRQRSYTRINNLISKSVRLNVFHLLLFLFSLAQHKKRHLTMSFLELNDKIKVMGEGNQFIQSITLRLRCIACLWLLLSVGLYLTAYSLSPSNVLTRIVSWIESLSS